MPTDDVVLLTVGHRHESVAALTDQGRIGCGFCEEDLDEVKLGPPPPPRRLRTGKVEANYGLNNLKLQRTVLWPLAKTMKATNVIAASDVLKHVAASIREMPAHAHIVKALEATRRTVHLIKSAPSQTTDAAVDKVGGEPAWIGKANWPACAQCGDPMLFLAQLATGPGTAIETKAKKKGRVFLFICQNQKTICPTWDEKAGANAVIVQPNREPATSLRSNQSLWAHHITYEIHSELPKPAPKLFKGKLDLTLARVLWTAETGGEENADDEEDDRSEESQDFVFENRLGGAPRWLQGAAPRLTCEACKAPMPFLGQLDVGSAPLTPQLKLGDSILYVFFCPEHERGKLISQTS